MAEVNWEVIILIIIVGLIIFAGMGIFIGTRISSDKRRIRELEDELAVAKKEMEAYRGKVNSHFKKTSELFTQMTSSYRAIYLHLAEGSQDLCTTDAALLKPANAEFLKVTHEEQPAEETQAAQQDRKRAGDAVDKVAESPAAESPHPVSEEPDKTDKEKQTTAQERQKEERQWESAGSPDTAAARKEQVASS